MVVVVVDEVFVVMFRRKKNEPPKQIESNRTSNNNNGTKWDERKILLISCVGSSLIRCIVIRPSSSEPSHRDLVNAYPWGNVPFHWCGGDHQRSLWADVTIVYDLIHLHRCCCCCWLVLFWMKEGRKYGYLCFVEIRWWWLTKSSVLLLPGTSEIILNNSAIIYEDRQRRRSESNWFSNLDKTWRISGTVCPRGGHCGKENTLTATDVWFPRWSCKLAIGNFEPFRKRHDRFVLFWRISRATGINRRVDPCPVSIIYSPVLRLIFSSRS